MSRRKDPPGYPGDEYITQRFYEMKDALRESAGMTREELEKAIVPHVRTRCRTQQRYGARWGPEFVPRARKGT